MPKSRHKNINQILDQDQLSDLNDKIARNQNSKLLKNFALKRVIDLVAQGCSNNDICEVLMPELGKSESQIRRYCREALELLEAELEKDIQKVRNRRIISFEKDVQVAYKNYEKAATDKEKAEWFKIYLQVKQSHDKYYINDLKPVDESKNELSIQVSYSEAKDE